MTRKKTKTKMGRVRDSKAWYCEGVYGRIADYFDE